MTLFQYEVIAVVVGIEYLAIFSVIFISILNINILRYSLFGIQEIKR